ncbi:hypothetical protein [Sodalinema sp.]|uniref:hypothetical protein n=1 Tax=Sodalinema sp. TaxID=3080550 RepID=UPI00396F52F9
MPPVFSAKNINGKRAYEYARKGEEIEMSDGVPLPPETSHPPFPAFPPPTLDSLAPPPETDNWD